MSDMSNNLSISHTDIFINSTFFNLIKLYSEKNFINIHKILKYDLFLPNTILFKFSSFIKCINKLRSRLYIIRSNKCHIINNFTLDMNPINEQNQLDLFHYYDILHKAIYIFNYKELINLYKSRLNYLQFEYMIPKYVCNPYTNLKFSIKDHFDIYRFLLKNFSNRCQSLPSIINDYKNSKFDIFTYHDLYYHSLYYKGYSTYLNNLHYNDWHHELIEAIQYHRSVYDHFCYECSFKKFSISLRILLHRFLIIHFLNSNNIYHLGDASSICISLLKKYNLWFDTLHIKNYHRSINLRRETQLVEYDIAINVSDDDEPLIIQEPHIFSRQVSPTENTSFHLDDHNL